MRCADEMQRLMPRREYRPPVVRELVCGCGYQPRGYR